MPAWPSQPCMRRLRAALSTVPPAGAAPLPLAITLMAVASRASGRLTSVVRGQAGLGQRVGVNHVADHGRAGLIRHFDPVGLECIYRKDIAMRLVADRRAGAAKTRRAEIGMALQRAGGQFAAGIAGAHG